MSAHIYRTSHKGRPVRIQAGWDCPLQHYYLVVEFLEPTEADADADDEGYLYSNLDDDDAWRCRDFAYFERKLLELGLQVPTALTDGVRSDRASNISNREVDYS
ncbi:hypothetical protein WT31_09425 [Burkholderia territorii]|uniref:hypothetical protein n=1 Tax=Burkholderia territorii TaxID=1503055 RepID=UPI00075D25D0|nr:hypothetical protein [Burkholderia territorii]KVX33886.1 hypothetical protein WT31_09425 [Burkholderia territorii]